MSDAFSTTGCFERAINDLKGEVQLKDGVAMLSRVSFAVPGAQADIKGTYSLLK